MKRTAIGIFMLVAMLFMPFIHTDTVHAADHKLEDLHIQVTIDDNGDAKIVETRHATLSEGTENYIVIGNLGKSEIKDFKVTEDGREYEFLEKWDLNASREEKAFKNGIISTGDGYELSWGIGDYGDHVYVVEYVITDFIKQLKDAQILFWRFVNDEQNIPPEEVTIQIESNKRLSDQEERIWAFGFTGDINFNNGKVVAQSSKALTAENYVTILVEFEDGLFATNDKINKTFEEIQDQAFVGSDYGRGGPGASSGFKGMVNTAFVWIKTAFMFFIGIAAVIFIGIVYLFNRSGKNKGGRRRFKRQFKEEYYRDYPYEGDHLEAYYIMHQMGLGSFERLFTSLLLKWIKDGRISVDVEEGGMLRKQRSTLTILDSGMDTSTQEGKLFRMLESAAGSKKTMNENQLAKWAENRREQLKSWENNVLNGSARLLTERNYLTAEHKKFLFFKYTNYHVTSKGLEIEENTYKFVNYLHDYSLLNEHEAVNVHIWDEMMVWASYLGLTSVVMKQFKSMYPKYEEESVYRHNTVHTTQRIAQRTSQARSVSRDTGGGGSASTGGGGGSFGGGSGGGTR